jgi:hypothetical protein
VRRGRPRRACGVRAADGEVRTYAQQPAMRAPNSVPAAGFSRVYGWRGNPLPCVPEIRLPRAHSKATHVAWPAWLPSHLLFVLPIRVSRAPSLRYPTESEESLPLRI